MITTMLLRKRKFKSSKAGIAFLFFILLGPMEIKARGLPLPGREPFFYLLASGGGIQLIGEPSTRFSFPANEFNHQPGKLGNVSLVIAINKRWEAGAEIDFFNLAGNSESTLFSANGYHPRFKNLEDRPVNYQTSSMAPGGFLRYYLLKAPGRSIPQKINVLPYLEAGAGVNIFRFQLAYDSPATDIEKEEIFSKGMNSQPVPGAVLQLKTGGGVHFRLKNGVGFLAACYLTLVDYDCLDGVHNYSETGEQLELNNLLLQARIGLMVPLIWKSSKTNSYLPFAR